MAVIYRSRGDGNESKVWVVASWIVASTQGREVVSSHQKISRKSGRDPYRRDNMPLGVFALREEKLKQSTGLLGIMLQHI